MRESEFLMTDRDQEISSGRSMAVSALEAAAGKLWAEGRLSATTLNRVVDIAWRYQFSPADRAKARSELREVLKPEVEARMRNKS
jgi:hypothetical protein